MNGILKGCLENSNLAEQYEYCGCYVNALSKNFRVLEVLQLLDSGKLQSNQDFLSIVEDCVYKSGFLN